MMTCPPVAAAYKARAAVKVPQTQTRAREDQEKDNATRYLGVHATMLAAHGATHAGTHGISTWTHTVLKNLAAPVPGTRRLPRR